MIQRGFGRGIETAFIDGRSGAAWGTSEYSTIDTALLVCGALFAGRYFADEPEIARLAQELYDSVDWARALADPRGRSWPSAMSSD